MNLSVYRSFAASWVQEARRHPKSCLALLVAIVLFIALILGNRSVDGSLNPHFQHAALAGLVGFLSTALGALAGFFLRHLTTKAEDSMLGFAAGMMLAASSFSLILPGLDAARDITQSAALSSLVIAVGLALGAALMLGLDRLTPHAHQHSGACGPGRDLLNSVWLFTLAITLHNLPEGMAEGVGFAGDSVQVGIAVTTAIAIQNVPEGLAVAMTLRAASIPTVRAVLIAAATGLMEPIGSMLGISLASGLKIAYPIGLGIAAGAMIFVVSHEVIPQTHRNGHQTPATLGLLAGFALMMVLDTSLG